MIASIRRLFAALKLAYWPWMTTLERVRRLDALSKEMAEMGDFRITKIWALLAIDPDTGDEGVVASLRGNGIYYPLVAADEKRIELCRPVAQSIADERGVEIKLVEFSTRRDVETLEPASRGGRKPS